MELWSRRKFFLTSLAGSAIAGATKLFGRTLSDSNGATATARAFPGSPAQGKRPLIISSANGLHALLLPDPRRQGIRESAVNSTSSR